MTEKLKIGDLIIDDTPLDMSDVEPFLSEEDEEAYWETRRKELEELKRQQLENNAIK
ncbi:MAG: hypothetical protein IKU43_08780 [Clostridia bacterium]|nr:hypothetical protein [Clostridia bacterium]